MCPHPPEGRGPMDVSRRSRFAGAVAALLLVGSAAVVTLPAAPASAAPIKVINGTASLRWVPNPVTVTHGTSIHWHAVGVRHRIKSYGGNWNYVHALPAGTTAARTFGTKGVFLFYCTIHGHLVNGRCVGMCGKITVT
jgi:plastocyanin